MAADLQQLDAYVFGESEQQPPWERLANASEKSRGRLLALLGAVLGGPLPLSSARQNLEDRALRNPRTAKGPKFRPPKSSARLDSRQALADAALRRHMHVQEAEACLGALGGSFCEVLEEHLPAAINVLKARAAKLTSTPVALALVKSMHWLLVKSDYTALRGRFGLVLPVLLQILDSDASVDCWVRLVGWEALKLLLDRAMAVELQNFAVTLEEFLDCHSAFLDDACLVVAPYSTVFVLLLLKGYTSEAARAARLRAFFRFAEHCKVKSPAFELFLDFGLLPLLDQQVWLLAPSLRDLVPPLLQSCESCSALESLLCWRAMLLLFSALPERLGRYFQDLLLRAAFGYLTFLASEPPEGLEDSPGGFRSPVVAAMTSSEWQEVVERRSELRDVLEAILQMLAQQAPERFEATLAELNTGAFLPPVTAATEAMCPQLQGFVRFAKEATSASSEKEQARCQSSDM